MVVTDRYPVAWSLLSAEAPWDVSGLTTEATCGALATSAAASLTALEYFESVSFPLFTCRTIGLEPLAWAGNEWFSASVDALAVGPGQLQVVAGVIAQAMRHRDERNCRQDPDGEDHEATPDAEPRDRIEHTSHVQPFPLRQPALG